MSQAISPQALREVFHFLFLERLQKLSDPKLYILKGGVNLRFFFNSPRYSEDMDLDVLAGSISTLKKNGYKILEDASFQRSLQTFGIEDLKINDPSKAKQTETTQRFRAQLINAAGESFPTKVEFSRRHHPSMDEYEMAIIAPQIAAKYFRLSFSCQHYTDGAPLLKRFERFTAARNRKQETSSIYTFSFWVENSIRKQFVSKPLQMKDPGRSPRLLRLTIPPIRAKFWITLNRISKSLIPLANNGKT